MALMKIIALRTTSSKCKDIENAKGCVGRPYPHLHSATMLSIVCTLVAVSVIIHDVGFAARTGKAAGLGTQKSETPVPLCEKCAQAQKRK